MTDGTGGVVLLLIGLALYFLPTIVACMRGKANGTGGVFFVNLFTGWTVLGWFTAFIWACPGETREQVEKRDRQHRELLEVVAAGGKPVLIGDPENAAALYRRPVEGRAGREAGARS